MIESFHAFLSHNSQDKPIVRKLAQELKLYDLRVWLDEEQLVPGRPWQEALETIIETTQAAVVLIGESGLGPWEEPEMRACLLEFVRRKLPVIPVLLPGIPATPNLPLFLRSFTWVDLRDGLTDLGLENLVWGITGAKPTKRARRGNRVTPKGKLGGKRPNGVVESESEHAPITDSHFPHPNHPSFGEEIKVHDSTVLPPNILVVEDNPIFRKHLSKVLTENKFICELVKNENEAVDRLSSTLLTIVADINLSESGGSLTGGILLAEKLEDRKIPIILISHDPWYYLPDKNSQMFKKMQEKLNIALVLDRNSDKFYEELIKTLKKTING
ncbi:MAG: TIR domain-containing protein [Candidatus Methylumidiphilus sp.]